MTSTDVHKGIELNTIPAGANLPGSDAGQRAWRVRDAWRRVDVIATSS